MLNIKKIIAFIACFCLSICYGGYAKCAQNDVLPRNEISINSDVNIGSQRDGKFIFPDELSGNNVDKQIELNGNIQSPSFLDDSLESRYPFKLESDTSFIDD